MTFWDSGTGWIKKKKNIFGGKGGEIGTCSVATLTFACGYQLGA